MSIWLLLVYLHGAHAMPTSAGWFDSKYECMLEKYKRPQYKAECYGPNDPEAPPYHDPYTGD